MLILLVNLHGILIPKWRLADEELVDQDAKCPPIDCAAVASILDRFWCEVFGSSA